jgi:hypothetical protein
MSLPVGMLWKSFSILHRQSPFPATCFDDSLVNLQALDCKTFHFRERGHRERRAFYETTKTRWKMCPTWKEGYESVKRKWRYAKETSVLFRWLSETIQKCTPRSLMLGKKKAEALMPARAGSLSLRKFHTELTICQNALQKRLEQRQWWVSNGWDHTFDKDSLAIVEA